MNIIQMIGVSYCIVYGVMFVLWLVYLWQKNAGILDVGWTVCFALVAMVDLLLGDGFWLRKLLLLVMIVGWSGRLGWHLLQRYLKAEEDGRYQVLREKWFGGGHRRFLVMFLIQAFLIHFLAVPFALGFTNESAVISTFEIVGVVVWLVGMVGEGIADEQLKQFLSKTANEGKVCMEGLWTYSRHPNYFFEWVIWIGFSLFLFASPWGILAIYPPIVMYILLTEISGIPLTEEHSVRGKGEAYKEYQQSTSAFVLWVPKK